MGQAEADEVSDGCSAARSEVTSLDQVPCFLLVVIGAGILSRDTKDEDKEDAGKLNYTLIV